MKQFWLAGILGAGLSCFGGPIRADGPVAEAEPAQLEKLTARIERLENAAKSPSETKRPTVNWSGQLQADTRWIDQDAESRRRFGDIENGSAFRRARFGMHGEYGPTEYRIDVDFALAGRPTFLDVFVGARDVPFFGRVRVGHFFEPFLLERYMRNRNVTFLERALPDQPFAPARNLGIMANDTWLEGRGTWALGLFRADSDVFGDDAGDRQEYAVTGRVTGLPIDEDDGAKLIHVGFGYSFRNANDRRVRFRSQPEARLGSATPNVPFFVDTGTISADYYQLIGLEAAGVRGPFSASAEWVLVPVDGGAFFHGWYVEGSVFLTGEHRPYRRDNGVFDRVIPANDFLSTAGGVGSGPGAIQLAARVSQLVLDSGSVRGGRLTNVTAAINWHLNPYTRITAEYVRAMTGHSATNIVGLRTGFEF